MTFEARYNLGDKFLVNGGFYLIGPRYYKDINISDVIPDVTTGKLPTTFDANLGVEYRYTTLLSFWVKINNLAAQRYYLYNQYPSFRFRFMAGFSYTL